MADPIVPVEEDPWVCEGCGAPDPPIFMCSAGWWCTPCWRREAGFPDEIGDEDLHDGINDGRWAGYGERLKDRWYSEIGEE